MKGSSIIIGTEFNNNSKWLRIQVPADYDEGLVNGVILGLNTETVRSFQLHPGNNLIDLSGINADQIMLKVESRKGTEVRTIR